MKKMLFTLFCAGASWVRAAQEVAQEVSEEMQEIAHDVEPIMNEASAKASGSYARVMTFFNDMSMTYKIALGVVALLLVWWMICKFTKCSNKSCSCGCADHTACDCHK